MSVELIVMVGMPASGKSTWVKEYLETHPAHIRVSSDDLIAMSGQVYRNDRQGALRSGMWAIIEGALNRGISVIIDKTNLSKRERSDWLNMVKQPVGMKKVAVCVRRDDCREVNKVRPEGLRVPEEDMDRMEEKYEPVFQAEGFNDVRHVRVVTPPTFKRPYPTLIVDFDGVIHSYTSGWKGATTIADPPVPGVKEALVELKKTYYVVIHSTRCHMPGGKEAIEYWMGVHSLLFDEVVTEKVPCVAIIDDRAFRFEGDWDRVLEQLEDHRPWNKKG